MAYQTVLWQEDDEITSEKLQQMADNTSTVRSTTHSAGSSAFVSSTWSTLSNEHVTWGGANGPLTVSINKIGGLETAMLIFLNTSFWIDGSAGTIIYAIRDEFNNPVTNGWGHYVSVPNSDHHNVAEIFFLTGYGMGTHNFTLNCRVSFNSGTGPRPTGFVVDSGDYGQLIAMEIFNG